MDFDALCKPYEGPDIPGGTRRTPARQRMFLVNKQQIPAAVADEVMAEVYAEVEAGRTFESGDAFDQHLLAECRKEVAELAAVAVQANGKRIENVVKLRMTAERVTPRRRARQFHAAAFAAGAATVGIAWLLTSLL
jgi:hypothetical protein